jgi:hypothetical protein
MSSTERKSASELAGEAFDEIITPLACARQAAGKQAYFPLTPEAQCESYFVAPLWNKLTAEKFAFPGDGTATGLVEALTAYWQAQGESKLAELAPRLMEIAASLQAEVLVGDGEVNIFCYTMY